jgi:penicillin-binding protein 2
MMFWRNKKRKVAIELQPDEILLDVSNLPSFDQQQFEGRLEKPISKWTLNALFYFMVFTAFLFVSRLVYLQIIHADFYLTKSENNSLKHTPLIADRGVIYDRNGVELAWNSSPTDNSPAVRDYIKSGGFANLLGYVSYPTKDTRGKYWQEIIIGKDGIEEQFNTELSGENGTNLIETDVNGEILSENIIETPKQGNNISLSIDSRVQEVLYKGIKDLAHSAGYVGGAGAIMNIETGELIAMTTYPEYNQKVIADGKNTAEIKRYLTDSSLPFLNRVTEGLYTPGSIIKPFIAMAALQENVIDPNKIIVTNGSLKIPNPYDPKLFTIFKDNANHGAVDMRKAIAVSSNVYFYEIGGGFGNQRGLGINNIEKYARMFGIGEKTGINIGRELTGTVPSVEWKAKNFPGDPWRIGDTYNTSIGQYGFHITPIQMLRAIGSIASRGNLVTPTLLKSVTGKPVSVTHFDFSESMYNVIHEAMRMVVLEGTAVSLKNDSLQVAAKTGTAQIKNNTRVNSWSIGFFPYKSPKYAFVVLMENGPKVSSGASNAFKSTIQLFVDNPELLTAQ